VAEKITLFLILGLSLLLTSCANLKQITDTITHSSDSSHNKTSLYILPDLDHGLIQSPINIRSFKEITSNTHEITIHFQDKIRRLKT